MITNDTENTLIDTIEFNDINEVYISILEKCLTSEQKTKLLNIKLQRGY